MRHLVRLLVLTSVKKGVVLADVGFSHPRVHIVPPVVVPIDPIKGIAARALTKVYMAPRFLISDFRFLILDFRFEGSVFIFQISDFGFQIPDCRFHRSDFSIKISGFRFHISDSRF